MKIEYINGFKTLKFKIYMIQERSEKFYGIYLIENEELITHKNTWKQATKLTDLLEKSYQKGYSQGTNDCDYAYEMDESENY